MALGFTQPLSEISTRNISLEGRVKGGRCLGLTNLPLSCADCLEIWEPQLPGTRTVCPDLQWDFFAFQFSPNINEMSRRRHILYVGETRKAYRFYVINPK